MLQYLSQTIFNKAQITNIKSNQIKNSSSIKNTNTNTVTYIFV